VVLATLILQGLTLAPLIRLLGMHDRSDSERELAQARRVLAETAIAAVANAYGRVAEETRRQLEIDETALEGGASCVEYDERQRLKLAALAAQRERLRKLRDDNIIGEEHFELLQEELDWRTLAIGPEGRRQIVEG